MGSHETYLVPVHKPTARPANDQNRHEHRDVLTILQYVLTQQNITHRSASVWNLFSVSVFLLFLWSFLLETLWGLFALLHHIFINLYLLCKTNKKQKAAQWASRVVSVCQITLHYLRPSDGPCKYLAWATRQMALHTTLMQFLKCHTASDKSPPAGRMNVCSGVIRLQLVCFQTAVFEFRLHIY